MRKFIILTIFCTCLFACDKTNVGDKSNIGTGISETIRVEKTIRNVFAWAGNKNFDLFYNSIENDTDFISVTPYERVKFGFSAVKEDSAFWGDTAFQAVGYDIHDLTIHFSADSTVAWFYCVLNDYNTWNDKPINWLNTRWTGVLEKKNHQWRVVQQHFSWAK